MKRVKKTRSIAAKLLATAAGVLVSMLLLFNMIGLFVFSGDTDGTVLILGTISIVLIACIFVLVVYLVLLKRLDALNKAVEKVAGGDYSVEVSDQGNDEISLLASNFNLMTKELQSNAMLSKDFVNYVSHELKTPLSVIRAHAEAITEVDDEIERKSYVDVIIEETDALAEMSKNIIMLCKLDNTNLVQKDDVFAPSEQIKSFILSTQALLSAKNLNIELDVDEFEIQGNASLSYIIWQNLINNAYKFSEKNGNVKIALKAKNNQLFFSVTDDGIGIKESDKEKIFTLFFVGNKSRNKEGNGIGLYLTKTIVTKLGGTISFESNEGKGSCFSVMLPAQYQP